ncbi:unnamed protein product [Haemonchus placei]|uniref:MFS domain-containing protein n=1 Tax=Haemonchus placei TaxID=6290 RepID=A0A0N4WLM2_HAEPC|nr:unnamed protein product [Haemonchus placei]
MTIASEEQQMVGSEPSDSLSDAQRKASIQKPEDVLERLGARHRRLLLAIVSCSFVWGFGALSIMSSAFTSIDCGNCTGHMITVTSEFELRDDKMYLAEWSTSFFMIGNMLGGCSLSYAADRFGRRPLLLLCLAFQAVFSLLASLCPSVHLFSICRLFQGACYTGASLVAWVAAYEHTHTDLRSFTTFLFGATWVAGYSVVALLAYISSTWREMMTYGALSTFIFTIWCWRYVPETLHFLVSRRKTKKIQKWLSVQHYSSPHHGDVTTLLEHPADEPSPEKTCDNFVYFGLSLYSTKLAGDPYTNYLLMGLVELPAYIAGPIALEKYGRKFVVSGTHLLAAICFIIPLFAGGKV